MSYNWTETFKNKTEKELFYIYSGQSLLDKEAREFAELELKRRNFNFKDIDKYKAKWKLERQLQEKKDNNFGFGLIPRTFHLFFMGIIGAFMTIVFVLDLFFKFIVSTTGELTYFERIIFITVGLGITIFGFMGYRQKKKSDLRRQN